jgi:hypothetical protein
VGTKLLEAQYIYIYIYARVFMVKVMGTQIGLKRKVSCTLMYCVPFHVIRLYRSAYQASLFINYQPFIY